MMENTEFSVMEIDSLASGNEHIIVLKEGENDVEFEVHYEDLFESQTVSVEDKNVLKVVSHSDSESLSEGEDPSSQAVEVDDSLLKEQERQLTEKFLDGHLTFSEYAALMGGTDLDLDGQADAVDGEDTTVETGRDSKEASIITASSNSAVENSSTIAFEIELQDVTRKRRRNRSRRRRRMPPALQGLMGEANLRYARGEREIAVKMCLEVIRQAPTAPEPFQTLAVLHEELGEPEKSLQFALIAAHLSPGDPHEWQRLAEMSIEQGDQRQAATCLSRAVRASPEDSELHEKLAQLLENLGDMRPARKRYHKALEVMLSNYEKQERKDASIPIKAIDLAKSLVKMYHGVGELDRARQALELAFFVCPKNVITPEDINIMLELLIELREYKSCLIVLMSHCGVVFNVTEEELNSSEVSSLKNTINSCIITEDLSIDILVKMLIVLTHLDSIDIVRNLMKPLFDLDPEESGDLYLDLAEALMSVSHHNLALSLLNPLVQTKNYGLAAVWLRKAECLRECGEFDEAVDGYKMVVKLAPGHAEARLSLSEILRRIGRNTEALEALVQDPDEVDTLDPVLLHERCRLLLRELGWSESGEMVETIDDRIVDKSWVDKAVELLNTGQLLISRHCGHLKDKEDLYTLTLSGKGRFEENKILDGKCNVPVPTSFPWQQEWKLLQAMCSICIYLKWYGRFQRLAFTALSSHIFNPRTSYITDLLQKRECRFLALLAAFYNKDATHAYSLAKDLILRESGMPRAWTLFAIAGLQSFDVRHSRFIMRMFAKTHSQGLSGNNEDNRNKGNESMRLENLEGSDKEDSSKLSEGPSGDISRTSHPVSPVCLEALSLIHANNCLISGTYKYAHFEYATLYQNNKNPIIPFLICISLLHMACQKFTANKHSLVVQSIALFSEYSGLRHAEIRQEVHYNMGRLMHHLGLYTQAIYHYEEALKCKPPEPSNTTCRTPSLNLQREIAYNLHLIYKRTGARELARAILEEYVVI